MSALEPIAILSNISTNGELECTVHCNDYRCMLRIKSCCPKENRNDSAIPDICSLSALPIMTCQDLAVAGRCIDNEDIVIPLLSKNEREDINTCPSLNHHPSNDLIRTAYLLQKQLHERLKDASNGTIPHSVNSLHGVHEEFLLRSEAVIKELLGAIQQHTRKQSTASNAKRARTHVNSRKQHVPMQSSGPPPLEYYAALLRQLKQLNNLPNVTDVNLQNGSSPSTDEEDTSDVTRISVTCTDEQQRSHTWHAELYPCIVLTVDLPEDFSVIDNNLKLEKWWEDESFPVLPEIQRRFQQGIDMYQPLFNELDQLDSNLWILEPILPARRCSVERRIALWEGGASLVIVLDPEKPRSAPVLVRFVGLTAATMKAVQSANGDDAGSNVDWSASFAVFVAESEKEDSASKKWSESRSVQENLEIWFGGPLPSPLSSEKSDYLVECGICYTHRLLDDSMADESNNSRSDEGALPDVKCNNAMCNRHYHEICLFEWLHSLPTAKNSFDRIFGSCPYCCETISVSTVKGHQKG